MGVNPELPGVNLYITTCLHGVDMRFTPRCYLCKPWPDDSPVWKVTSPGHVHEGEWCALCVEAGSSEARAEPRAEGLDVDDLESIALALQAFPTWFGRTADKVEAMRLALTGQPPRLVEVYKVIPDGWKHYEREDVARQRRLVTKPARAALEDPTPGPQYTEDDPDWSAMVSPISETDAGHDDR